MVWTCVGDPGRDPGRKVILLSVYDDEQYLFQAMRVGASRISAQGISSDELVRQLEGVRAGRPPSTPAWRPGPPRPPPVCRATSSGPAPGRV